MSQNDSHERLRATINEVVERANRPQQAAGEIVLSLPAATLSQLKFGLEDLREVSGLRTELNELRAVLAELRATALGERPELADDEGVRWVEDILDQHARLTGQAWRPTSGKATVLSAVTEALSASAEERAKRFAKGSPLDLNGVYREIGELQNAALDDGGLGQPMAQELRELRRALDALQDADDEAVVYIREYTRGFYSFLVDEELLGAVDDAEQREIDAFLG